MGLELLTGAFKALGGGAHAFEIKRAADILREANDEEVMYFLKRVPGDKRTFDRLCALAEEAGSSSFVALDLATAYQGGELIRTGIPWQ
jgi:hypothetical protein